MKHRRTLRSNDVSHGPRRPHQGGLTGHGPTGLIDPVKAYPPKTSPQLRSCLVFWAPVWAALASGCAQQGSSAATDRHVTRGLEASERSVGTAAPAPRGDSAAVATPERPAAIVDGTAIPFDLLRPALTEAAGALALEEAVLDILVQREFARAGKTLNPEMIQAERDVLLEAYTSVGLASSREDAGRLLAEVRRSRGLGETRFAALLRRNAMLRSLVSDEVRINPAALDRAYDLRYAERYRARLIVVPGAAAAQDALTRLRAGEPFGVVAAQVSTDPSADRGGIIDAVSPADETYPVGIRLALRDLAAAGAHVPPEARLSAPIAVDGGYAILLYEGAQIPATPAPQRASVEELLQRDVRLQQERLLMDQRARLLLANARVSVLDRALSTAWEARRAALRAP